MMGSCIEGRPTRGKVGQPSVPYSLDPDGALAFGLKIGRRSVDLYLINLVGEIVQLRHQTYAYPIPSEIKRFAQQGLEAMTAATAQSPAPADRGARHSRTL